MCSGLVQLYFVIAPSTNIASGERKPLFPKTWRRVGLGGWRVAPPFNLYFPKCSFLLGKTIKYF